MIKKGCSQAFHPSNEDELEGDFDILIPQFQAGLRSFLGVPLVAAGVAFGAIRFNSATPNAYTEEVVKWRSESLLSYLGGGNRPVVR